MGKPGSIIEKNAVQNEEVDIDLMLRDVELSGLIPDVGIDDSLVKYSGLYSAAQLEKSITQVLKDRTSRIPGFVQSLSSHSLKHWTNGAAFHLQMLIHAARLKQNGTVDEAHLTVQMASIISVLNSYQFDLEELLKKYKTYIRSNIFIVILPVNRRHFPARVGDKEFGKITVSFLRWKTRADEYVDYMFDNPAQLKELKCYFSNLKENIKDLIMQNNEFNMQSVLFVSNSQDACCM